MVKNPSLSKLRRKKIHPLVKYNRETGETEVSTYETFELEDTTTIEPHRFILSFTVHMGLQKENDWMGFDDADKARTKKKELNGAENVTNINLSAVMGKIDGQ